MNTYFIITTTIIKMTNLEIKMSSNYDFSFVFFYFIYIFTQSMIKGMGEEWVMFTEESL